MDIKEDIQHRLSEAGLLPNKVRGQHFLVDENDLEAIVNAAHIKSGGQVIEIGPGVGNLTDVLLKRGASIIVVEKDEKLSSLLGKRFGHKIEVRTGDILSFDEKSLPQPYTAVGNIPYYITGKIIKKFLERIMRDFII